jgi:nitrogen regulatory protein PII-like uncharacterized protein
MKSVLILVVVIAFHVSGCTSYQSSGATGGFSETQLSPTMYQVRFVGNGYTSEARATEFFLRRCAELALENGYRYFNINDERGTSPNFWDASRVRAGTLRFLEAATDDAADAVLVIRQTDERAANRLSVKARVALSQFEKRGE